MSKNFKKFLKTFSAQDLRNLYDKGVDKESIEEEIFKRFDESIEPQVKVDLVLSFPKTFLFEFGIENLDAYELYSLLGKMEEFNIEDLLDLKSYKKNKSIKDFEGDDVIYEEIKRRFNENRERFELFILAPEFINQNFSLKFLSFFFPRINEKDFKNFLKESVKGKEDLFTFDDETLEEEIMYKSLKAITKKYPKLCSSLLDACKFNRQFLKDFEFWEWLCGKEIYKNFFNS